MGYLTLQSCSYEGCARPFSKHNILSLKSVVFCQMSDTQNKSDFNSQHARWVELPAELQASQYTKVSVKGTSHGNLPLNTFNILVGEQLCIGYESKRCQMRYRLCLGQMFHKNTRKSACRVPGWSLLIEQPHPLVRWVFLKFSLPCCLWHIYFFFPSHNVCEVFTWK